MAKQALPLPRGSACLHCRRRKVKCDAQRPVCGPCMRGPDPDHCDYDLGIQGSVKPEDIITAIAQLRDDVHKIDLGPIASTIMTSMPMVNQIGIDYHACSEKLLDIPSARELQEPPTFIISVLLYYFERSLSSFPFFLSPRRFQESALLPIPIGNPARPHPAVLSATYLCSLYIASLTEPGLRELEPNLLQLALQYVEEEQWRSEPGRVIEIIQAELLLSVYFFKGVDMIQGRHHLSRSLELCFRARLNLSREHAYLASLENSDSNFIVLPETNDPIQIGERINALWAVLTVHNTWMPTLGVPPLLSFTDSDRKIETPWPLDMSQYERGMVAPSAFNSIPIQNYLRGAPDQVHSYLSYATKASLLYEQASQFSSGANSKVDTNQRNSTRFRTLMGLIQKLLVLMPTYQDVVNLYSASQANEARQRIFAKSCAHAAQIALHSPFAKVDLASRKVCFESASQIIVWMPLLVDVRDPACGFDPIQATFWKTACKALVDEILILRSGAVLLSTELEEDASIGNISKLLQQGVTGMRRLSLKCPMGRYQYIRLQESLILLQ